MDHVLLKTERMILRRFTEDDLDNLFELDNDPEVMRYINGGTPTPREIIQKDILPAFLHYDDQHPAFGFWAAENKRSPDFLGWFTFRPTNIVAAEISLGYRFCRSAWGRGYATEGVRALIRKGFTELGVQRVVAITYEENRASRHVLEKAGLTIVRRFQLTPADLKQVDTFHAASLEVWDGDDLEYALEKSEWIRQNSIAS